MVNYKLKSKENEIIEIIEKKGYASLTELKESISRQSLMKNLRNLLVTNKLHSFIEVDESVNKQTIIQDSEIYFENILKNGYENIIQICLKK